MKKRMIICLAALIFACLAFGVHPVQAATSGSCGQQVQWNYDAASRTLTISGQGPMEFEVEPWLEIREKIEKVVIEEGVTSIADQAFCEMQGLQQVTIAQSVTAIGASAFEDTGIRQIQLPDGLTSLGNSAFENCALEQIKIPAGVTELPFGLFRRCKKLQNVELPDGLLSIENDVFTDCTALQSIAIPDTVTQLAGAFLRCTNLKTVHLSESLQYIGTSCFQYCKALEAITIPDSVTLMEDWAFQYCFSLKEVTLGIGLKEWNETVFMDCKALERFAVKEGSPYFWADEHGVLYSGDKGQLYRIPTGFTGAYTVSDGTQTIGNYAAYGCEKLSKVTLPDSVKTIGRSAFTDCEQLMEVDLGKGLEVIAEQAFKSCDSLQEVVLPESLKQLDNHAFGLCGGLKSVHFLGSCPKFDSFVFANASATAYYPAEDVTWQQDLTQISRDVKWQPLCSGEHRLEQIPAVAPSCTEAGQTAAEVCSVCGYVTVAAEDVPATGHQLGQWVLISAEDVPKAEMRAARYCSACDYQENNYAYKVGLVKLDEQPAATEEPSENNGTALVLIAVGVVAVCFVAVEICLLIKKKKK